MRAIRTMLTVAWGVASVVPKAVAIIFRENQAATVDIERSRQSMKELQRLRWKADRIGGQYESLRQDDAS